MTSFKHPPKGYLQAEFPLPHNFQLMPTFSIDNAIVQNATYIPILMNDEGLVNPDTVNANPEHGSFAESDNVYCYKNSIVPKINFTMELSMMKGAIETDKIQFIKFYWMPVYVSFLNRLDASDSKTGTTVEAILELEHETVGKSAYPIWGTVDIGELDVKIHANATTALMGMTTNDVQENIVFDRSLFFDALQYYTNAPMLKKVIGTMKQGFITRDRPFRYHSSNFTNPMVKRINPYTFCGVLIYFPKAGDPESHVATGDVTNISHVRGNIKVRYDEWNSQFDQTSS